MNSSPFFFPSPLILAIMIVLMAKEGESEVTRYCPVARFNEGFNKESYPGVCGMQLLFNLGALCRRYRQGLDGLVNISTNLSSNSKVPLISKSAAHRVATSRGRRSSTQWNPQNIICECCFNYCTQQEMLGWC